MAEAGDASAQTALGLAYERGVDVTPSTAAALHWYRRAAAQNSGLAQYHIGSLYERGKGVAQDYREAARWYRRAAGNGSDAARTALAYLYEKGLGVDQSYRQARDLYHAAAHEPHEVGRLPPDAAVSLGRRRVTTKIARTVSAAPGYEPDYAIGWHAGPAVEVDLSAIDQGRIPSRLREIEVLLRGASHKPHPAIDGLELSGSSLERVSPGPLASVTTLVTRPPVGAVQPALTKPTLSWVQ